MSQVQWAEDDFDLPQGVVRFGPTECQPVEGRTYVMYHGTTRANARLIKSSGFRQSPDGMLGRGVYLSRDLQKASRYPIGHAESDRAVIKVSVNVGKVIAINRQGHPHQKTWHDHGYDTAWVPPNCGMVKSGLEEDCVWDPARINIISIINPTPPQGAVRDQRRGLRLQDAIMHVSCENQHLVFQSECPSDEPCSFCQNCGPKRRNVCSRCGAWHPFHNTEKPSLCSRCGNWLPFY